MIRSMTGFAAISREDDESRVRVTVKSVNHRFLDVALKSPTSLNALDSRLRAVVQRRLARGRVEIMIALEHLVSPPREVIVDQPVMAQLAEAVARLRDAGHVSSGLTAGDLLRIPQLIEVRTVNQEATGGPSDRLAALVEAAVGDAVEAVAVMRETEGQFLADDLAGRMEALAELVDGLARGAADGQQHLEARLRERLDGLPADLRGDATALAQEIVRFVARSDIEEELVRLRSHLGHWRSLVTADEPCGRKLDFLVQEMNREVNTIGSKADGTAVTERVIAAKADLERVREQVQNVE